MDYTRCRYCKNKVTHVVVDYFLYCNKECESAHKKESLEKRLKENETHNPPARRGEIDRTNELIKQMLAQAKEGVDLTPEGKPKGKRQCGKCGEYGHNARTCKEE